MIFVILCHSVCFRLNKAHSHINIVLILSSRILQYNGSRLDKYNSLTNEKSFLFKFMTFFFSLFQTDSFVCTNSTESSRIDLVDDCENWCKNMVWLSPWTCPKTSKSTWTKIVPLSGTPIFISFHLASVSLTFNTTRKIGAQFSIPQWRKTFSKNRILLRRREKKVIEIQ